MKKVSLFLGMVLAASFAIAQTDVNLNQSGNSAYWATGLVNDASIQQSGTNVILDVDQIAGTDNYVRSGQSGTNLSLTYEATAKTSNSTPRGVNGFLQDGSNGDIDIKQVATNGSNSAQTWQQGGLGYTANQNNIDVVQNAGTNNVLVQRQSGRDNIVNLNQNAGTYNHAETNQGQWGALETNNKLVGAALGIWGPGYDLTGPAKQTSATSYNYLKLDQVGSSNLVGLYQNGNDYNSADIYQAGGENSLLIYQTNNNGFNSVISDQIGGQNSASVLQTTVSGNGTIVVNQN